MTFLVPNPQTFSGREGEADGTPDGTAARPGGAAQPVAEAAGAAGARACGAAVQAGERRQAAARYPTRSWLTGLPGPVGFIRAENRRGKKK